MFHRNKQAQGSSDPRANSWEVLHICCQLGFKDHALESMSKPQELLGMLLLPLQVESRHQEKIRSQVAIGQWVTKGSLCSPYICILQSNCRSWIGAPHLHILGIRLVEALEPRPSSG